MAKIKKTDNAEHWLGYSVTTALIAAGGDARYNSHFGKHSGSILQS